MASWLDAMLEDYAPPWASGDVGGGYGPGGVQTPMSALGGEGYAPWATGAVGGGYGPGGVQTPGDPGSGYAPWLASDLGGAFGPGGTQQTYGVQTTGYGTPSAPTDWLTAAMAAATPQPQAPLSFATPQTYGRAAAGQGTYGGASAYGGALQPTLDRGTRTPPQTPYGRQAAGQAAVGAGSMPFDIPTDGIYGQQKWLPGSTSSDIFLRRGSPITARTGGQVLGQGNSGLTGGGGWMVVQFDDGTVARFRHVQPQAQGAFRAGQSLASVNDPGMDMLGPYQGMPDGFQHLDLSINRQGNTMFPTEGGGGGDIPASQWLQQRGYGGRMIPGATRGPQGAGGGGGGNPFAGMFGGSGGMGMPAGGGTPFAAMMGGGNPFLQQMMGMFR